MITVTEYKGQKVGVFGLGKAGEAAVTALAAGGAKVFKWDDSFEFPLPMREGVRGRGDNKAVSHREYPVYIKEFARALRKNMTEAEKKFWKAISNKKTGYKFRKQFVVDSRYIADFVCLEKRLIIEIDGGQHSENIDDTRRTSYLESQNFRVIRFWNNEILENLEGCYDILVKELLNDTPHPNPPPQGWREYSEAPRESEEDLEALHGERGIFKIPPSEWDWARLKAVILSPGVPLTHPKPHPVAELAKQHNVPIIGEVELLFRSQPEATYIGITGTNGKSTTTALIAHILKESGVNCEVGGNLGVPALALEPLVKGGVYVLEMSSYQLDLMRTVKFNVAVLLNITPDHLDRHGDMAGYIAAKKHIFDRQEADDVAVVEEGVNVEWCLVNGVAKLVKISVQKELDEGVYVKDGIIIDTATIHQTPFAIHQITSLTGKHNWQNAAAAYAACRAVGIAPEKIYEAMRSFGGLRHRLQLVATINGVCFINDSKATNADATRNALAPYKNIRWIIGGKAKAGGIASLEKYFQNVAHAFLIGEAAEEFAKTLEGKVPYTHCGTLDVAVMKATEMAKSGDVVLLSPACASFDQFKSFEHRGDVFCELVEKLANGMVI
ncbi:MAG: UDP-N-acetylmuramoyl-L-alanine--D-glutamate ligase [Rickettsiales bacterium]